MSWIAVDVETDGQVPGLYSMVSLGAILVQEDLENAPTFYAEFSPISTDFDPAALAVSGHTREQTICFPEPYVGMYDFKEWIEKHGGSRPMMVSDNPGFDFAFVSWYFWNYLRENPFGYKCMHLASLYKGVKRSTFETYHDVTKTPHTHHPVDDARGMAEALLYLIKEEGLKISLK